MSRCGLRTAEHPTMNASLDSVPSLTRQSAARAGATVHDLVVRDGILEIPGEVSLYHGGKLPGMRVAWRMVGPANAPIVCALGGISAHRRPCFTDDPRPSWWG